MKGFSVIRMYYVFSGKHVLKAENKI